MSKNKINIINDAEMIGSSAQRKYDYFKLGDLMRKEYDNVLVLCHGDFDGIVCAIMIKKNLNAKRIEIVFTLPKWINKNIRTEPYDLVVVLDIAVNNRNPKPARQFIEKNKEKLVWIDHHYSPNIEEILTNPKYKSCVSFIKALFPFFEYSDRVNELIELAHLSDQGKGDNIFHKALKVNQKSDETRYEIFRIGTTLQNGELFRKSFSKLREKAKYYDEVQYPNTLRIANNNTITYGVVSIADIRHERERRIDMTELAFELYKRTPIVVIKYYGSNRKEKEFLKISTRPDAKINLLEMFKLPSGAPFKITVPNDFEDSEIVDKLTEAWKRWKKES